MPQAVTLHLVPDPESYAVLHGKDVGTTVAKAIKPHEIKPGDVDYEVSSHIAVHGTAKVNGKTELASLLVFQIQATSPRRRPIEEMMVRLVFKCAKPQAAASSAPRLLQIIPDQRGYKVECTQGSLKYNKEKGVGGGLAGGADVAKVNMDAHRNTGEELEQSVEFYTHVYGNWSATEYNIRDMRNLAYWSFEGRTPNPASSVPNGAVPPVTWIAMLLSRREEGVFTVEAQVHLKVDWKWALENKWNNLRYTSPYGALTYDTTVSEHPDPEKPIPVDKLEAYLKQDKMKELVNIMMPIDYEKWKYDALPKEEDE